MHVRSRILSSNLEKAWENLNRVARLIIKLTTDLFGMFSYILLPHLFCACLPIKFMYMLVCKFKISPACACHIASFINPCVILKGILVWFMLVWSYLIHVWFSKGFRVWFLLAYYVLLDHDRIKKGYYIPNIV